MTWIEWYHAVGRISAKMAIKAGALNKDEWRAIATELKRIAEEIERHADRD